ncbi:MAG: YchE family NAAT transporter [Candidatus Krumholzibacteria bacterium]|nr:YchE family NAAT transporter [Candidatus Krumholzibacteria bacterium]
MLAWNEYVKIIIALIVIIDPLGAIPIFIGLTAGQTDAQRGRTARVASLSVAIILIVSCLIGEWILKLFGISIASFRIGGGILLLLMSIAMMNARISPAKRTESEEEEAHGKENIAVVPLAIPLLAGPGAISLVIIYADKITGAVNTGVLILICIVASALMWGALRLSVPISKLLGQTGINIATRIMGLILAAISIEFIASGYKVLFR